jgi:hypothetical protein
MGGILNHVVLITFPVASENETGAFVSFDTNFIYNIQLELSLGSAVGSGTGYIEDYEFESR